MKVKPGELEDYQDWVSNPVTRHLARRAALDSERAYRLLLSACRTTSDPEVRAKYQAYVSAEDNANFLAGKGKYAAADVEG